MIRWFAMKLQLSCLEDRSVWDGAQIRLPAFDIAEVRKKSFAEPAWIHFGAGNIFRAFPAMLQQELLNQGIAATGIIVAEGYDYQIIDDLFIRHDNLSLLVTLKADGTLEKTVIASMTEALKADRNHQDFNRLKEIFRKKSLQMASFTITEKGYSLVNGEGRYLPDVEADFTRGPEASESYMGKVAALLYERFIAGRCPLAMVSMDNCSHNGDKLFQAVHAFAEAWSRAGLTDPDFTRYIENPDTVSFPWSMIDKITPRPDEGVRALLEKDGFEGAAGLVTEKNTYIAPFVNAEEAQYLVIEDLFPNGRPPLDKAGVIFTNRDTVNNVEKMKVCTCLNPLHTALAVFGCLLGYTKISDEMKDDDLKLLVERLGYDEGLPVVVNPGIIDPRAFIEEVLTIRFPNSFMPDTPQRIATDTSQKLAIRFGETIKAYLKEGRDINFLKAIPLVQAGWLRYLLGFDDAGEAFTLSPDPLYDSLKEHISGIRLGDQGPFPSLRPVLSDERIFGIDLYQAGLAGRVEELFTEMLSGKGAVRQTIRKQIA